ncbi:gamma carbonic anhydrase family protein [Sphingopyxis sp. MWB1]|uniref:gamma carbonic anhydrase family protein n=1 Tax=Sphingopyxis sp. MWB1 TaxID=1537715 RepID=UPI00051A358F|nr:gamma carbonic anhydrase family protein [Sphingopyxis sp. MWB1]
MNYPDVSIISVNGKTPQIDPSAFIAPGCRIIGDVVIGPDVSIWYNCVLRADVSQIRIGARSNVQDGSVLHCDGPMPHRPDGYPTIIGEDVLIGHMAMVHGCTLDDRAFVGLKATVMNGCRIGSGAMLAAGALLTEHKEIPARELWAGAPARRIREIGEEQAAGMQAGVAHYVENGRMHKAAVEG